VPEYNVVDFSVVWNADMTDIENYSTSDFDSSDLTDSILCDSSRTSSDNMNSATTFWKSGLMHKADGFVGFSRNNVLLGNALTSSELDATAEDEL
jgi:hypothetical protein